MVFQDPILAGATLVRDGIQSEGYVAGSAGWRINRDGTAEFNTGTFRGSVVVKNAGTDVAIIDANGVKVFGNDGSTVQMATGGSAQLWLQPPAVPGVGWLNPGSLISGEDGTVEHRALTKISTPQNVITSRRAELSLIASGQTLNATSARIRADTTQFVDAATPNGVLIVGGSNGRVSINTNGVEETWHPVAFLNGWSNLGGGFVTMQYRRVASPPNSLQLVGVMNVGTKTSGAVVGNLPAGYRPLNKVRVPVSANATYSGGQTTAFDIMPSGDITVASGTSFPAGATDCEVNDVIPLDA